MTDKVILIKDNALELRYLEHNTYFISRAAAIIVQNGKLLTANSADIPGLYYTIGGAIRLNETSEEAIIREVYEEVGVKLEVERPVFINERYLLVKGRKCHEIVFYYLMKSDVALEVSNGTVTDQQQETLHWLPLTELDKFNLVPPFLKTRRLDKPGALEHIISKEY